MPFASGGYHGLYYVAEDTYGTTPDNPAWTPFRHTDCSLGLKRDKFESKELRSDRAITDVRLGTYKVEGDVGFELSYSAFDDMLEALMGGTWSGDVLRQGVTQRSFSILRKFADITQYECFSGCSPSKLSLDIKPSGMATGKLSFIGSNMTAALPAGSTFNSASANPPMDTFSASIYEGGVANALCSAITLTLDNGLEANFVVGSKYAPQISWGRSKCEGKGTFFFTDMTMLNKFLNETASSLRFITGSTGLAITWLINNLQYTTGDNPVNDEKPIPVEMSFNGLHHTLNTNLQITRHPGGSASPSVSPSISPSVSPSISPSISPSVSPSISPSLSPSLSPSVSPSASPSA
jgi:hypothetical protein